MKIDGRCHCGQIAFEADADPKSVTICHCTDCQRLTGSAFRVFLHADPADFAILSGRPRGYVKTAESGSAAMRFVVSAALQFFLALWKIRIVTRYAL
jgi:hypothetical protein